MDNNILISCIYILIIYIYIYLDGCGIVCGAFWIFLDHSAVDWLFIQRAVEIREERVRRCCYSQGVPVADGQISAEFPGVLTEVFVSWHIRLHQTSSDFIRLHQTSGRSAGHSLAIAAQVSLVIGFTKKTGFATGKGDIYNHLLVTFNF